MNTDRKKWPTKPAAGQRCDASDGWKHGVFGEPLIITCKNPAVETVLMDNGMSICIYLCAFHAEVTPRILRNPKRKSKPAF